MGTLVCVKRVPGARQGADLRKPGFSASAPCAAHTVSHTRALPSRLDGGSRPSVALPFFSLVRDVMVHWLGAWYALREFHMHRAPKRPPGSPTGETVPYLKNGSIRFSCHEKHKIDAFPSRPPMSTLFSRMEHSPLSGNRSPGLFLLLNLTLWPLNFIFLNSESQASLHSTERESICLRSTHEETEAGNSR